MFTTLHNHEETDVLSDLIQERDIVIENKNNLTQTEIKEIFTLFKDFLKHGEAELHSGISKSLFERKVNYIEGISQYLVNDFVQQVVQKQGLNFPLCVSLIKPQDILTLHALTTNSDLAQCNTVLAQSNEVFREKILPYLIQGKDKENSNSLFLFNLKEDKTPFLMEKFKLLIEALENSGRIKA